MVPRGQQEGMQHHLIGRRPQLGGVRGDVGSQRRQLPLLGKGVHAPLPGRRIALQGWHAVLGNGVCLSLLDCCMDSCNLQKPPLEQMWSSRTRRGTRLCHLAAQRGTVLLPASPHRSGQQPAGRHSGHKTSTALSGVCLQELRHELGGPPMHSAACLSGQPGRQPVSCRR